MDASERIVDEYIEREFGWMLRVEIGARLAIGCVAFGVCAALLLGLWRPSIETTLHWLLAVALLWLAGHLLRTVVGAWANAVEQSNLRRAAR